MEKIVQVENVEMTFNTRSGEFPALAGINLTVDQGDFVTLIGHSGCGKSTLLNLIAGLITPTHGHISSMGAKSRVPAPIAPSYFKIIRCCRG